MRMEVVGDARIDVRLAGQLAEDARYDDERGTVRGVVACDINCLLYTSPSPRDRQKSRMPSSA